MKKLVCAVVAFVCGVSLAADLRWVNWNGDLKAGTASNWEPAQVPQAGDNLTIFYNGSGTKYWHNDLDIVYGHITVALTNTSNTRVDFDQKEVRVTDGFSFVGEGGSLYPRTAITGTGEFLVDNAGGTCYLPTSPTSGRVYSGDFMLKRGQLSPSAKDVLGSESEHGKITIVAHKSGNSPIDFGKLVTSGSGWSIYNDIYYDNTSSAFAFHHDHQVALRGTVYFTGGGGTFQGAGSTTVPMESYGKWENWTPEGQAQQANTIHLFVQGGGIVFRGGYEDKIHPMSIWGSAASKVTIASEVVLPQGVLFKGAGTLVFACDTASATPLPLSLQTGSIVDFAGTSQKIGDITVAANATPTLKDSVGGGEIVWSPTKDSTFAPAPEGRMAVTFDAEGVTGTFGSAADITAVSSEAGTLVIPAGAALPNVTTWSVSKDATLSIAAVGLPRAGVVRMDEGSTFELAEGVVLEVYKAYVGTELLAPGDYTYGEGTLRVVELVYTWTGAASDGDLNNPQNWNVLEVPDVGRVFFSSAEPLSLHGTLTGDVIELADGTVLSLADGSTVSAGDYQFGEGARIESAGAATLEFTGTSTCADLPVSPGVTVKVSGGTVTFASDRIGGGNLNLETYAAEGVAVAAGVTVSVYTLKVNGEYVNPGEIAAGGGTLSVYTKPVDPAEEWSVWTGGAGAEDKSIFAAANWEGEQTPDLASGEAKLRFPAGAEVEIPSGVARAYQLDLQGAFTTTGEGSLAVGAGGAAVAAAEVTFGTGVDFLATPQQWLLDGAAAKITFAGPLGSRTDGDVEFLGNGNAKVLNGIGNVTFLSACAETMTAGVVVSNLLTDVKHGEALGRERGLTVWAKGYNYTGFGAHLFQTGLVVKFPVRFYGHRYELTNSTSGSTDNVLTFDEPVWFYCDPDLGGTAVSLTCRAWYVFNAPVWTEKGANSMNACMGGADYGFFFNDTLTLEGSGVDGRYFAAGSSGWLHLAKPVRQGGDIFAVNATSVHLDCRGADVLDPNKGIIFYYKGGTFRLNGHDQSIPYIWPNFAFDSNSFVTVDSQDDVAVLRLTNPQPNYKNGDYPLVCTGKAGVEFVMVQSTQTCTLKYGVSNTRGPLIVSSGTLAFAEGAKWCGRGAVKIANGAKVQTGAADVFGSAELGHRVGLEIAAGGILDLGANQSMRYFIHDGKDMEPGTYGAPGSGAEHEMDCFTGTGILTVTSVPKPGVMLIVR